MTRPLTKEEERRLLRYARRHLSPRDRTIITAVLFAGIELTELRQLAVRDVFANGQVKPFLRLPTSSPRSGGVCEMPVTPEFARALRLLRATARGKARADDAPLILSVEGDTRPRCLLPLSRKGLTRVIQRSIRRAGIRDDRQLGPGSLRKRFAERVWRAAGHDMLVLRDALRVWSVLQAMEFIDLGRARVESAMRKRYRMAA